MISLSLSVNCVASWVAAATTACEQAGSSQHDIPSRFAASIWRFIFLTLRQWRCRFFWWLTFAKAALERGGGRYWSVATADGMRSALIY